MKSFRSLGLRSGSLRTPYPATFRNYSHPFWTPLKIQCSTIGKKLCHHTNGYHIDATKPVNTGANKRFVNRFRETNDPFIILQTSQLYSLLNQLKNAHCPNDHKFDTMIYRKENQIYVQPSRDKRIGMYQCGGFHDRLDIMCGHCNQALIQNFDTSNMKCVRERSL